MPDQFILIYNQDRIAQPIGNKIRKKSKCALEIQLSRIEEKIKNIMIISGGFLESDRSKLQKKINACKAF